MIFNLYKHNKKVDAGNPKMLTVYTDAEIKEIYKRFDIRVEIVRGEK